MNVGAIEIHCALHCVHTQVKGLVSAIKDLQVGPWQRATAGGWRLPLLPQYPLFIICAQLLKQQLN